MASVTAPNAATPAVTGVGTRNYARIIEQTWIWSIVGYSLLRFFIAWGAFSEHGANVWVFGLIDVGTAWPYAKSVASVCKRAARSEWRRLALPLGAAISTFFAPYAYLWFAAGEMPGGVRVGLAICVSVLLVAATAGVLTKTHKLRNESQIAAIDHTAEADALVGLASSGTNEGACLDLRADNLRSGHRNTDSRPEIMIDLTGDTVDVQRPAATY